MRDKNKIDRVTKAVIEIARTSMKAALGIAGRNRWKVDISLIEKVNTTSTKEIAIRVLNEDGIQSHKVGTFYLSFYKAHFRMMYRSEHSSYLEINESIWKAINEKVEELSGEEGITGFEDFSLQYRREYRSDMKHKEEGYYYKGYSKAHQ